MEAAVQASLIALQGSQASFALRLDIHCRPLKRRPACTAHCLARLVQVPDGSKNEHGGDAFSLRLLLRPAQHVQKRVPRRWFFSSLFLPGFSPALHQL